MSRAVNWNRILFATGVLFMLIGAVDPLEGSLLIAAGSCFLALAAHRTQDRHRHLFRAGAVLILTGVAFMFYFSYLGGFGKDTKLTPWWGLFILPYPIGWVICMVILIYRMLRPQVIN